MKIPQLKATFAFVMSVILLLFSCSLFAQGSTDTTLEKLRYQLSPELQKRLSGVKYGIINATKEEVDNAINQRDYQDLISNVAKYFELRLGIKYFGFTATQIKEVMSKDDVSICDIVEVGLDPGTFKRTFGAIGVYRDAALLFKFCDGKKYRVQLEDISVDGYSYHPNRFYAAFNRLKTPTIKYNIENRLEIKTLRIVSTRDRIDSIVSNNQYPFVGEFQSLGLDQISASYRIAIIPDQNGFVVVYTGGLKSKDWVVGELKSDLTPTKSEKIFLCKWYDRNKNPVEGVSIIFDDFNSFQVKSESINDKYVRIR